MASAAKKLRSDNQIFLVGKCESELKGAKLPNMKQVLQLFFYKTRVQKLPVKESIKNTIRSTLEFWQKAYIPTMTEINCVKIRLPNGKICARTNLASMKNIETMRKKSVKRSKIIYLISQLRMPLIR